MASDFDLLVFGDCNPDLILSGEAVEPWFGQRERMVDASMLTIGGSASITACGAARLGLRTAFAGIVGDDVFGRFMLDALAARGVDVSGCVVDPDGPTALSVVLSKGDDRATLTAAGVMERWRTDLLDRDLLRSARLLHSVGFFASPAWGDLRGLFAEAHEAGLSTSLDPQGEPEADWGAVLAMLPEVDVFFPNSAEARAITGIDDADVAAGILAEKAKVVAAKFGQGGGMVVSGGDVDVHVEAVAVDARDSTGAGDSFDAGFLAGYLNGWSLDRCLRLAIACGSLSTRSAGGTEAQPSMEEALAAAGVDA